VLFLYDAWDEFVMEHLHSFEGKTLKLAEKADLNLSAKKEGALSEDAAKALAQWIKEKLGDKVGEVRTSQRLVESPAVVVDSDKFMTASMRRIMKAMKRDEDAELPSAKHDLEINPAHPIISRLDAMRQKDADLAANVAEQLLDNARVAAGLLEDPRTMLNRLNQLLEKVLS
jgi:molecular chaperone HtpG